ncbi:rRNA maturation RNase YbeY [Candidatus Epulonipiscium fishelsonii]|uniref:rRNA maturation RNase YbeY n=1 Tax=Candidatus Epulonipiscium fishelsonii TaxID=77094 RepID=A0ACC8XAB4_9FIRM|nr:rRNA maturation RNase YbeY [Epulopiscium sp. SCG-B11WGA-EpuloA1]ONI43503.1 rRNA maturation RNase YbeY [Epulopiscium sp. SCG-B05WGA-EpuloA1]
MYINLEDTQDFLDKDLLLAIEDVIKATLEFEQAPNECEISLTIVDKDEIQQINKEYRNIDKVTDVLSFPQIEMDENGKLNWPDSIGENIILGDIVLCFPKAIEQSSEYGHTLKREVCFLVVHSMLHLLGYDHMEEEAERQMIQKQNEILINIQR